MADGPVYFIGGTFGAGRSSGWVIAIITALVTSAATFWVGYFLEEHKRRRDVRALAATFIAEISAILQLFDQLRIEDRYRALIELMRKQEPSATWAAQINGITFPITVYEKCADRVGTLGGEAASRVVRFYNFLNGCRSSMNIATGSSSLPIAGRIEAISFMLDAIAAERPKVEDLLQILGAIANRRSSILTAIKTGGLKLRSSGSLSS